MFPHVDGDILNDEIVIIHPSGSVGEPEIFEPNTGVCLPSVLGDVGGWSKALWERRSLDTPVVRSASVPGACFTAPLMV